MKKRILIVITVIAIICYFFTDVRYTIKLLNVSAAGNEPALKTGDILIGTNLKNPKKLDFVFYQQNIEGFPEGIWFQRLCGVENDTIQIIEGTLYVNSKNVDENLILKHRYKMDKLLVQKLLENREIAKKDILEFKNDTAYLNLTDKLANQYPEKITRSARINHNKDIVTTYGKHWTEDNFGPIVVPKNSFFFVGDNRNFSYDSRFFGFVDKKKIKGVMLND